MDQRLHSLVAIRWNVAPGKAPVPQALPSGTKHRLRGGRATGVANKEVQRYISHAGRETAVLQLPALYFGGCFTQGLCGVVVAADQAVDWLRPVVWVAMCCINCERLHSTSELFDHGEFERMSSPRETTLGRCRSAGLA